MSFVALNDLNDSLRRAQEKCLFFDSAKTFSAIPIIGLIFGLLFALLPAWLSKKSALSSLASKINGKLDVADPAIVKVAIQGKNLLVSEGYRCEHKKGLRAELIERLQPVLGDLLSRRKFLADFLPFWLNVAFVKLNHPNFQIDTITEETLKALLQKRYISSKVLPTILEHKDKIEAMAVILSELKKEYILIFEELSDLINFRGDFVDALKAELLEVVQENFQEKLTISKDFINEYLPTLLEISLLKAEHPGFEIDQEGLEIFKPNQKISEMELEAIKAFVYNIDCVGDLFLEILIKYSLSFEQLSHFVGLQFGFEVSGMNNRTAGHFHFINAVKQCVNKYLVKHPDFELHRKQLFNCVAERATWDTIEDVIVAIRVLIEQCPEELEALMAIKDQTSEECFQKLEELNKAYGGAIKLAQEKERALAEAIVMPADVTDSSSDERAETSSGSRSPSVSSEDWSRERVAAQQGSDVYIVLEV